MRIAGFIAGCVLGVAALGGASPAFAAAPDAYTPPPPPLPPPSAPPTAEQVESLRQRLLASQQTIATLERQLADAKNRGVAMEQCRVKNGRLVFIGRELIEGYERRYRDSNSKDPLQLGRRRFEFELQALSEAVYDNRADVPERVPGNTARPASPAPTSTPHPRSKDK